MFLKAKYVYMYGDISRFASTAIDWLGGQNHMVESGANFDLR